MSITGDKIKGVARGLLSDIANNNDAARADHVFVGRYVGKNYSGADVGTNVNLAETPVFTAKYAGRVLRSRIVPTANIAINTTNYVFLQVAKSTAGAASTVVATLNTAVTALTKNLATALALNTSGVTFLADDVITFTATKFMSAGTASIPLAAATDQCEWSLDLEESY
jgi:hypothetical protein